MAGKTQNREVPRRMYSSMATTCAPLHTSDSSMNSFRPNASLQRPTTGACAKPRAPLPQALMRAMPSSCALPTQQAPGDLVTLAWNKKRVTGRVEPGRVGATEQR